MPKIEMGVGFKVIVYFVTLSIVVGFSIFIGIKLERAKQVDSNVEVLAIDSQEGYEIAIETKENVEELEKKIEELDEPIVDSDGYMSDNFMQLMESAVTNAERRGNKTGFIHTITRP